MPLSLRLPANWRHTHLARTGSTMEALSGETEGGGEGAEFTLLTTDYQSRGRGQRGTSWEAAEGKNLLFGFTFRPVFLPAACQFFLSEALALAVAEALECVAEGFRVKWPNDIYHGERKICGMLLEHRLQGGRIASTLTGVGVNVNQAAFRGDAPNPVSLLQITGRETDRATLLQNILALFEQNYRTLRQGDSAALHTRYMRRLYHGDGTFRFADREGEFAARVSGISPLGRLELTDTGGRPRRYAFKEVRFLPENR